MTGWLKLAAYTAAAAVVTVAVVAVTIAVLLSVSGRQMLWIGLGVLAAGWVSPFVAVAVAAARRRLRRRRGDVVDGWFDSLPPGTTRR